MTTYFVPVNYIISDDNEITAEIYITQANTPQEARENVRYQVLLFERMIQGDEEYEPSIWLEEEQHSDKADEEGYQIGPAFEIRDGAVTQVSESLWIKANGERRDISEIN